MHISTNSHTPMHLHQCICTKASVSTNTYVANAYAMTTSACGNMGPPGRQHGRQHGQAGVAVESGASPHIHGNWIHSGRSSGVVYFEGGMGTLAGNTVRLLAW